MVAIPVHQPADQVPLPGNVKGKKDNYFDGDGKEWERRKAYPRKREDAMNECGMEKHREHLAAF